MTLHQRLLIPILALGLSGCTAQQWETTGQILAATALITGAVAAGAATGYIAAQHQPRYIVIPARPCFWSYHLKAMVC